MGDLETLKPVTALTLTLTADDTENLVDLFGTLSIVNLCPVITSTNLIENEVVEAEELSERSGMDGVHGARF